MENYVVRDKVLRMSRLYLSVEPEKKDSGFVYTIRSRKSLHVSIPLVCELESVEVVYRIDYAKYERGDYQTRFLFRETPCMETVDEIQIKRGKNLYISYVVPVEYILLISMYERAAAGLQKVSVRESEHNFLLPFENYDSIRISCKAEKTGTAFYRTYKKNHDYVFSFMAFYGDIYMTNRIESVMFFMKECFGNSDTDSDSEDVDVHFLNAHTVHDDIVKYAAFEENGKFHAIGNIGNFELMFFTLTKPPNRM